MRHLPLPRLVDDSSPSPTTAAGRDSAADAAARPLLLMDIDGVISLFGFAAEQRPAGSFHSIDGIPHFLSAEAAEHLLALSGTFDVAWCSGWEEKANEHLPHLLDLPGPLPYLSFDRAPGRANAHWKLGAIDAFAGGRALAWVDDAFNDACWTWAARRPAPTLLLSTDPTRGLEASHVRSLRKWAARLDGVPQIAGGYPVAKTSTTGE